jgi:hypothetical protein
VAVETAPEVPADHGKRNLWLAIAGGALLALAVVVGLVVSASAPPPAPVVTDEVSKPPADALDNGTVPDVTDLAGKLGSNGKVVFTWTNPQPKDGDTYKWHVNDFVTQEPGPFQLATEPRAEVEPAPGNITCIQVMIVRADGGSSPMEADSKNCFVK